MRKNKLILFFLVLISIITTIGFTNPNFPQKKNFYMTTTVSKKRLKVGDKLVIKTTFRNLTDKTIRATYGCDNMNKFIWINIFGSDNPNHMLLVAGWAEEISLKPKQVVTATKDFIMEKADKYDVVACVYFTCYNSAGELDKNNIQMVNTCHIVVK